jgi:hypothetical protein
MENEDCRLLGCDALWHLLELMYLHHENFESYIKGKDCENTNCTELDWNFVQW